MHSNPQGELLFGAAQPVSYESVRVWSIPITPPTHSARRQTGLLSDHFFRDGLGWAERF
jgi:hypothetical protein